MRVIIGLTIARNRMISEVIRIFQVQSSCS